MPDKILLLDGNSLINRAFYAIPLLTAASGEYTNAVYGFFNILFKLIDEEKPDYAGVAFDLPKPTFRHEMYAEYKGTRKAMPDELRSQLPLLKDILRLMGLPIYEIPGYEADDVLGTLARIAAERGMAAVIASGDRDLLQCADDTVKIRIPRTRAGKTETEDYYKSDVIIALGVTPEQYIGVKALMGDASDNIPGVPGIGEKTAFAIIKEFKTIQNALDNIDQVKPKKAAENLTLYRDKAELSLKLATIDVNAPVGLDLIRRAADIYTAEARSEMERLGLRSLLPRFKNVKSAAAAAGQISLFDMPALSAKTEPDEPESPVNIEETVKKILTKDKAACVILLDDGILHGISVADVENSAFFAFSKDEKINKHIIQLKPFFESDTMKITADIKADMAFLAEYGVTLTNAVDARLACYLLDVNRSNYGFVEIAGAVGESIEPPQEFFGKGRNKNERSSREISDYAKSLAELLWRAFPALEQRLDENCLKELYYKVELPLSPVLADMERAGILVDRAGLADFGKKLDGRIQELASSIYNHAGGDFNINSPKQLGEVLFTQLGLTGGKKTKTGLSTAAGVLEELSGSHPIIDEVLEYRSYTKLKSTYADGLLAVANGRTGRIHTTFNQAATATGRLSSLEPNLQNIPIRTELGSKLREYFIPADGYVFLDADYSQIELRLLAVLSGDETLIAAFRENKDIHRITASQIFKVEEADVTDIMRRDAKVVNFGIIYGISAFTLSKDASITVKEAERYIAEYFARYPDVKAYLDGIVKRVRAAGYAETLFGRRRAIPELTSSNYTLRSFGERAAMNMPIQGTAADIIKIAMINVAKSLAGMKSRLILQVHDELLLEVWKPELDDVIALVRREMEGAGGDLGVPLAVDIGVGENWLAAK